MAFASISLGGPAQAADTVRTSQWHMKALDITKAHEISRGDGVVVAVLDSGVQEHKDLKGGVTIGHSALPNEPGAGRIDLDGHGTGMAGLIAARGHGATDGALGIAPASQVMPIRIFDKDRSRTGPDPKDIASAIDYAVQNGAKVINASVSETPTLSMTKAIRNALSKDVVVVASIGNSGIDVSGSYPATEPGVVAVGGTDQQGKLATISTRDPAVSICAPAVDIVSTSLDDTYRKSSGTSNSAAIVSGVAALLRSKFPSMSAPDVIKRMTATADDEGIPGRDDGCGFGIVNPVKALTADVPPAAAPGATPGSTATPASGGNAARPDARAPRSTPSSTTTILSVAGVLVLVGGLAAFLISSRRRKASSAAPRPSGAPIPLQQPYPPGYGHQPNPPSQYGPPHHGSPPTHPSGQGGQPPTR